MFSVIRRDYYVYMINFQEVNYQLDNTFFNYRCQLNIISLGMEISICADPLNNNEDIICLLVISTKPEFKSTINHRELNLMVD